MTYAIGNVFYGVDLTGYNERPGNEWTPYADTIEEFLDSLITSQYSGNGSAPTYIGVDMFTIDECSTERPRSWTLEPTEAQVQEFHDKIKEFEESLDLDDELTMGFFDLLKAAKPDVWLVWGSS